MTGSTPVLGLTLPGGGGQNKYGPADIVDIDKINDNFSRIDGAVGIQQVADANLPANPYLWQVVRATTTDAAVTWNGSQWANFFPVYLTRTGLAATYFTQDQLSNQGSLDSRYFTQTNLLNDGKLDSRYPNRASTTQNITPKMLGFKVMYGSYTATTTADGTRGYSDNNTVVNFSSADNYGAVGAFTSTPRVFLSVSTGATAEQHYGVGTTTATSFKPYYWRSDTVDPTVYWFAIGV